MTTFVLIHGAGDVGWYWHLVAQQLEAGGHKTIAPDMPIDNEAAGLNDYADAVIAAVEDQSQPVVIVGHSFGGYVAPIVASRIPTKALVLVSGMIPTPGESASEMFENTGYQQEPQEDPSDLAVFYHDVDPDLGKEALSRSRNQAGGWSEPWPLTAWPDVPTKYILAARDRVFPAAWVRTVVRDRLGVEPDEIDAGHCVALADPVGLTEMLVGYLGADDER